MSLFAPFYKLCQHRLQYHRIDHSNISLQLLIFLSFLFAKQIHVYFNLLAKKTFDVIYSRSVHFELNFKSELYPLNLSHKVEYDINEH